MHRLGWLGKSVQKTASRATDPAQRLARDVLWMRVRCLLAELAARLRNRHRRRPWQLAVLPHGGLRTVR